MSPKRGAITQRMPLYFSAQTAPSREEPQPKLSPASRIGASRNGARFSTNPGPASRPAGVRSISNA